MLLIAGSAALLSGCSAAVRLSPLPASHPASAEAPEPPPPPRSETLRSEAPAPSARPQEGEPSRSEKAPPPPSAQDAHAGHGSGQTAGSVVYTCPTHPTVKMDKPGSCPICGMTLVKKDETRPHEHQEH